MKNSNYIKNAYKGLLLNFYFDYKSLISVSAIITLSLVVFDFLVTIIVLQFSNSMSNENSGVLVVGFVTMLIALGIYASLSTSKSEMKAKFAFPINRMTFAVSNLIALILGSLTMLMVITMIAPIEVVLFSIAAKFSDKLIYVNEVTLNTYLIGFISSWVYMIAFGSILHCMFMFIRRYTLVSLIVIAALILSVITFGWLGNIVRFLFLEQSLFMLVLKLGVISLVLNVLAFIPTKTMEVA
ncbi:MAG: hypothetical protein KAQ68_02850 [Clostridiales bacterium]|nr:hypothetical protein [Clostridiales bacterium]